MSPVEEEKLIPENWEFRLISNFDIEMPLPHSAKIEPINDNAVLIESGDFVSDNGSIDEDYFFFYVQRFPKYHSSQEYTSHLCYSLDGKEGILPSTAFGDSLPLEVAIGSTRSNNTILINKLKTNCPCGLQCPIYLLKSEKNFYHVSLKDIGNSSQMDLGKNAILNVREIENITPAIQYLLDHSISSGYPDGSFKPERTINRAEFTKIIVGAVHDEAAINECPALSSVSPFPDVKADDWFMPFTCTARRFGIMDGYPDGTFRPAQEVNTAEAAKIVAGAFGLSTAVEMQEDTTWPANRSPEGEGWYQPYLDALNTLGAIPVSAQDPAHLLTRGEMAEIVYAIMQSSPVEDEQ